MSSLVVKKRVKVMKPKKSNSKQPVKAMPAAIESSNFDLELCWCIQQLQNSLLSGKLNDREAQKLEKAIKVLKSPTEMFIKKRQLMQQLLGDYREKMKKEEKKHSLGPNQIKFTAAKPSQKSYFVKKSAFVTPGSDFKFNFAVDQIEKLDISDAPAPVQQERKALEMANKNFHYVPSGNTFRFDFKVGNDVKGES